MTRPTFTRVLACLFATALFPHVRPAFGQTTRPQTTRPNIVVILSDDMGYSDIQPYGSEIRTPNLQRLADAGLRFSDFYVTPRCSPSRAALLTGQYSHAVGMGHLADGIHENEGPGYRRELSTTNNLTMAELLKSAGYETQGYGKWHVTSQWRGEVAEADKYNWPLQRGFDSYYGIIRGAASYFDPVSLTRGNTVVSPFGAAEQAIYPRKYYAVDAYRRAAKEAAADPDATPSRDYYHLTDAISDAAVAGINAHFADAAARDKPLFQYVAYTSAHWPLHVLPEDARLYETVYDAGYEATRQKRFAGVKALGLVPADEELPPMDLDNWNAMTSQMQAYEVEQMKAYAGIVTQMDRGIGRIVEALRTNGQLDNTLILYMQDNGGNHEGDLSPDAAPANTPARADGPTLEPQDMEMLQPALRPRQTRDGYPLRGPDGGKPVNDAGAPDTYEYYSQQWGNVSNTPFQTYKSDTGEGGIASPLIVRWGNGIPADLRGTIVRDPSHLVDVMATLAAVSGAKYPAAGGAVNPLEGVSLLPTFAGGHVERKGPLFWEHEGWRAAREGNWKLLAVGPGGVWELYDMAHDRAELHNVAADNAKVVADLTAEWEAWARADQVLPWPWRPAYESVVPEPRALLHLRLDEPSVKGGAALKDAANADLAYPFTTADAREHATTDGVPSGLGGAVRFDAGEGGRNLIRIGREVVPQGAHARTFAAWVNVASVNATGDNRLFAYQNGGTPGGWFAVTFDRGESGEVGAVRFRYGGNRAYRPAGGPLKCGTWFHLAVVMPQGASADDVKVYVNGVEAEPGPLDLSAIRLDTMGGDLGIGGRPGRDAGLGFDGAVADFQIYNRALSGGDVAWLARHPGEAVASGGK